MSERSTAGRRERSAGPTGRELSQPVGAPRSAATGVDDAESGANETFDGLSGTEEIARKESEDDAPDLAEFDTETEDTPVFDRAGERTCSRSGVLHHAQRGAIACRNGREQAELLGERFEALR